MYYEIIMFVGEIIEITADENIRPLVYHNSMYWKLGDSLILDYLFSIKSNECP
jgi:hypothetical protein